MAAVVLDIGSRYTRSGFAGEGAPRHIIQKRMTQMMHSLTPRDAPWAAVPKSVDEWKLDLRQHLDDTLFGLLLCNPKDRRVVVVEDLLAPNNMRQALAECLFEMQVPSVMFAPSSPLALLPTGSRTGIVCDLGAEEVRVLPIFDGVPVVAAYCSAQLGKGVTQEIHSTIREHVDEASRQRLAVGDWRLLEDVIARCCLVPPRHKEKVATLQAELANGLPRSPTMQQWLERRLELAQRLADACPAAIDGCELPEVGAVSAEARCAPGDVLFGGDEEDNTAASLVVAAILNCPTDIRRSVLRNIVVAGGYAMLPGALGRFLNEIEDTMASNHELQGLRPDLCLQSPPAFQANTFAWVGGSIIGFNEEQLVRYSVSIKDFKASREAAKLRSEESIMGLSYDELVRIFREMDLEIDESEDKEDATDIMRETLNRRLLSPQGHLPDWTRAAPCGKASMAAQWFFRKRDEASGREWSQRASTGDSLKHSWGRELDAGSGSGWIQLSDKVSRQLEAALLEGKKTVDVECVSAGTQTVGAGRARGVEYCVDLVTMQATRSGNGVPGVQSCRQVRRLGNQAGGFVKAGWSNTMTLAGRGALPAPSK